MLRLKNTIIFLLTILSASIGLAQHPNHKAIDSLLKLLPVSKGIQKIDCLNELSKYYSNYLNPYSGYIKTDSAELYANEAFSRSESLNYKAGMGMSYLNLAELNNRRDNEFAAHQYFEKAILIFKEMNMLDELNRAYIDFGQILMFEGDFIASRNEIKPAIAYFKNRKDSINEARALRCTGQTYEDEGYYETAYEYDQNGFNLTKNFTDSFSVLSTLERKENLYRIAEWFDSVVVYSNKIVAYQKTNNDQTGFKYFIEEKWDSSEYYFLKVYDDINFTDETDPIIKKRWSIRNDIDLASIYQREGKYKKALPLFMNALQFDKEKNIVDEEMEVLLNITQVYSLNKMDEQALHYAHNLLATAQKSGARPYIRNAYEMLWKIYDERKDSTSAYKYFYKYILLKDSINTDSYKRKLAVINQLTNEREQKAQIIALNKDNQLKENAIQNNVLIKKILFAGVCFSILLAGIGYRVISLKRKNEKITLSHSMEMERIENEKKQSELQNKATDLEMQALRAQMNPHFIFNCLSSINRFILKNETEAASNYLTKFSRLIRMVLTNSKKQFISMEDELETFCLYLDMEKLRFKNSFDYRITFINSIDAGNIFVPPLLLQPFAENAIWHGLMHKEGQGHLEIELKEENKILSCTITDNGIGRAKAAALKSKSAEKQKSMGLQMTAERLALLNKENDKQTSFNIEDIFDNEGRSAGTRVILKINCKDLTEFVS